MVVADDHFVPRLKQRHLTPKTVVRALVLSLAACLFSSSLRADVVETKTTPFALGAEVGTAGYGPTAIFTFSKYFTATAGYTWLSFNYDASSADANYSGKLKLSNVQAFVNWHPYAGTFHLSAGAFVSNNRVTVTGKPKSNSSFDVGGTTYTAAQIGTLSGEVEVAKNTEPYIGFGWAKKPLDGGIGFFADFGVLFTSTAKTKLGATGPIASDPAFQTNLRKEEKDINHDLKPLRYYPIVQLGLLYRF
jgi:hypothetical protein